MNKAAFLLACLLLASPSFADGKSSAAATSEEIIHLLIAAVETSGCTFIRNNKSHGAEAAADHLRLKLRRGKRYADTPEEFIENLASKSSWTGKPYYMDCPDSGKQPVNQWLRSRLDHIRQIEAQGG